MSAPLCSEGFFPSFSFSLSLFLSLPLSLSCALFFSLAPLGPFIAWGASQIADQSCIQCMSERIICTSMKSAIANTAKPLHSLISKFSKDKAGAEMDIVII